MGAVHDPLQIQQAERKSRASWKPAQLTSMPRPLLGHFESSYFDNVAEAGVSSPADGTGPQ